MVPNHDDGNRGLDAELNAETLATRWMPGVNNPPEFRDMYEIERAITKLVKKSLRRRRRKRWPDG